MVSQIERNKRNWSCGRQVLPHSSHSIMSFCLYLVTVKEYLHIPCGKTQCLIDYAPHPPSSIKEKMSIIRRYIPQCYAAI